MKVNRTYTLSEENVRKLGEIKNASALIDGLLRDFFNHNDETEKLKQLSIPELETMLELETRRESLKEELEKVENELKDKENK